ncbi:hypothetical protein KFE94_12475 [bacterium SCSIO 12643]|nr:hypothetical protein KFE94_12475 [bacterium SCSIO 12643]
MKHLIFYIVVFISTSCWGQSLFFNDLKNTLWSSDSSIADITHAKRNEFGLEKLSKPIDSLTTNRTIWYFRDSLRIKLYNTDLKQERLIGTFAYQIEGNHLIISFNKNAPILYSVGVTSTGTFALLTPSKDISIPLKTALKNSDRIDHVTFDLKFLLRSLPDNGWFLKLNADSSYEYIHWNGWGDTNGTVLETGKYVIKNNRVRLKPDQKKSDLSTTIFFLVTTSSTRIDDGPGIDCLESQGQVYCLYQQ